MREKVMLSIKGLQMNDADEDVVETLSPAIYENDEGTHCFHYEEIMDGCEDTIPCTLKIREGFVQVSKRGKVSVDMIFEQGQKNETYYYTPYGNLQLAIDTSRLSILESEDEVSASIDFALEMNQAFIGARHIEMKATNAKK